MPAPEQGDAPPRWHRWLEPLRSESAMFRVLQWTVAVALVVIVVVTLLRAIL